MQICSKFRKKTTPLSAAISRIALHVQLLAWQQVDIRLFETGSRMKALLGVPMHAENSGG